MLKEDNEVDIRFTGTYRKDGNGLHHAVDADDGEVYLYTQFEPFHANKCFPCFDQPDIKATMKLRAFSPADWQVISNRFESETTNSADVYNKFLHHIGCPTDVTERYTEEDNMIFRQFETTEKISTYLYAFVVGPYVYETNRLPNAKNYVPMRVMARKSVMKYVKVEDFFRLTMAGMDYYAEFFGRKYPFKKYDQIFVPEFNMGAMENVGCVTFTEHYLFRGEVVPQSQREQLAITILHELAHMWFGNLVTMKWWDDLWLNESFATFMSHMALANAEGLDDYTLSWELFMFDKVWGLKTDQLSTTHSIAADCQTTEDADNIFDGISYGKGASFLKQMVAYISEQTFSNGLKTYFKKYAFKNTELIDFVQEMQFACDAANQNIKMVEWADSWIKTSGFNIFESEMTVAPDGNISSFKLHQTLAEHGKNCLREQNIEIAFFNEDLQILEVCEAKVKAQEVTEIQNLVGVKAPSAYLLNYNDWGYGKFMIDENSLEVFKKGLHKIENSLSRKLIHNTIFFMTRDAQLSAHTFADFLKSQIAKETNQDIVLEQLSYNLKLVLKRYVPLEHQNGECDEMLNFLLNEFLPQVSDKEMQQVLIGAVINMACTEDHFKLLKAWLEKGVVHTITNGQTVNFDDIKLSPEHEHRILNLISTSTETPKDEVIAFFTKQLENDENKDLAKRCRLACESAIYDKDIKQQMWDKISAEKCDLPIVEQQEIMKTLMPVNQIDIIRPFIHKFFEIIPRIFKVRERDDRDPFFFYLSPDKFADEELLQKYRDLLNHPEATKSLKKHVQDDIERIEKYLQGQKLYLDSIKGSLKANM